MTALLPYDAEVEYLESTGTQWIVPDFSFKDADGEVLEIWCTAMSTFDGSPNTITRGLVCNNLSTDAQSTGSAVSIQFYWAQTWRNACNGWANIHGASSRATNRTCYVKLDRTNNEIYREMGTYSGTITDSRFAGPFTGIPYVLFANSANGDLPYPARIWSVKFAVDGVVKCDLIPVRFTNGLGQAEGAMYDRVSRKLFRNQGTEDPFVLGPDKAATSVPVMGLHFMRRPRYTAKDYVQGGLVAMWDGIENAGWGKHVSSSSTWKDLVSDYTLSLSSGGFGSDYKYISDVAPVSSCYGSYSFSAPSEFTMELAISQLVINGASGTKPLFMLLTSSGFVVGMIGIQSGNPPTLNTKASNASNSSVMDVSPLDNGCFAITLSSDGELKTYYNGTLVGARTVTAGQVQTCCITTSYRPRYSGYGCTGNWHRMSIYSRALTADEIAHNYAVDKERFNLP